MCKWSYKRLSFRKKLRFLKNVLEKVQFKIYPIYGIVLNKRKESVVGLKSLVLASIHFLY